MTTRPGPDDAFALERVEGMRGRFDESRPEHQILGRVADEDQLWKHDEVGAQGGGLIAGAADDREVAGDVSDDRIDLRDGYREAHLEAIVTHGCARLHLVSRCVVSSRSRG